MQTEKIAKISLLLGILATVVNTTTENEFMPKETYCNK